MKHILDEVRPTPTPVDRRYAYSQAIAEQPHASTKMLQRREHTNRSYATMLRQFVRIARGKRA